MGVRRTCGWCGLAPLGVARIGDVWYCHPDHPGPSCYEKAVAKAAHQDQTVAAVLDHVDWPLPQEVEDLEALYHDGDR